MEACPPTFSFEIRFADPSPIWPRHAGLSAPEEPMFAREELLADNGHDAAKKKHFFCFSPCFTKGEMV